MENKIQFYGAPMEGVTGYTFRNVHYACYPGIDRYFSPFLSPNQHHAVNPKEKRDILPENNKGVNLIPQVLTNKPELMLDAAKELLQVYGYDEVNLNLGCPSKTVVSKHKGSGFLEDPEKLDRFLEEVFSKLAQAPEGTYPDISIKTRLGLTDPEEFEDILNVYNKYPMSELIIHPRVQKEFYSGKPHLDAFAEAVENCPHSLCYNGDIWTVEDYIRIRTMFPTVKKFMLGRGLVAKPELITELLAYEEWAEAQASSGTELHRTEMTDRTEEDRSDRKPVKVWSGIARDNIRFKQYHDRLLAGYMEQMLGDGNNVLFKMKECWGFMDRHFPEQEKLIKKLKKAGKLSEYEKLSEEFFERLG